MNSNVLAVCSRTIQKQPVHLNTRTCYPRTAAKGLVYGV